MKVLRKLRDRLHNRVGDMSVVALVVGLVSIVFGVDIAPDEVDKVMTGIATVGAVYGRVREARRAANE